MKIEELGAPLWVPTAHSPVLPCTPWKTTIRTMPSRKRMKTAKNTEIARGWNSRKKRNLTANDRQEVKLGSQKPPKDGNESQTHGLSNALLHSSVRKSWNRPHLVSKSDPKSNFRVFRGFHLLSRRHRSNSGFPLNARMDWTWWVWNSKGSSQLLDLHFQFLIQRSTLLFTDPPCSSEVFY